MPPLGLFIYQLACVGLGIARAALDEFTELAQSKPPSLYTEPMAARAAAQVELARAEAGLGAARSFLYERVETSGRRLPPAMRRPRASLRLHGSPVLRLWKPRRP